MPKNILVCLTCFIALAMSIMTLKWQIVIAQEKASPVEWEILSKATISLFKGAVFILLASL